MTHEILKSADRNILFGRLYGVHESFDTEVLFKGVHLNANILQNAKTQPGRTWKLMEMEINRFIKFLPKLRQKRYKELIGEILEKFEEGEMSNDPLTYEWVFAKSAQEQVLEKEQVELGIKEKYVLKEY